jgi:hypothetical protein
MNRSQRLATLFVLAIGLAAPAARGGDIVVDFNDLGYPGGSYDPNEGYPPGQPPGTGSYDDGWDLSGGFTSNGVSFSNYYNTTYNYWGDWAYSNINDPTKSAPTLSIPDYFHQFAAITGTAPDGSGNYAIESGTGGAINLPAGTSPVSFMVTNTTYNYLSMAYGDGYAKKFTTNDYFELKIYGYTGANGSGTKVGEVDFYLANYTSADSLPVSVWTTVDLSKLAGSQSLTFDYDSSDFGPNGLNTPLSFAMDDLVLSTASAVPEPSSMMLALAGLGITGFTVARRRRHRAAH